jgi:hypothetical protein
MKTFNITKHFLSLVVLFFLAVSCSKNNNTKPDEPQIEEDDLKQEENSDVPAVSELSMLIDGKKWEAKYVEYLSTIEGLEPGEIFEHDLYHPIIAYSKTKAELKEIADGSKDHDDIEAFHISFVIPASKAHSPTGIYKFNNEAEQSQNSIQFRSKDTEIYTINYDINPSPGAIDVIKQGYGDRGSVNGNKLGYGLNNLEGTFEFELNSNQGGAESKSLKITEGKFKVRPFK